MQKSQSRTIHVGLAGEHLVASTLAPYCIVRSVGQGQDTGIDLYCEIVAPRTLRLFLHFFCQVKTTRNPLSIGHISKDFTYWAEQPVPVFVFNVVYDDITRVDKSKIWIYDVPYLLARRDAAIRRQQLEPRPVETRFLLTAKGNNKDAMDLKSFVCHHVPFAHGMWQIRRYGLVLPNPEINARSRAVLVGGGLARLYRREIERTIGYGRRGLTLEGISPPQLGTKWQKNVKKK